MTRQVKHLRLLDATEPNPTLAERAPAKPKRAPRRRKPSPITATSDTITPVEYRRFQTEKQFQAAVVGYARACGWYVMFTWNSKHSPFGEPDLRLVRVTQVHGKPVGRYVLLELKTEKGKLSPHQVAIGNLLKQCAGVEYYVIRPTEWESGFIENLLQ